MPVPQGYIGLSGCRGNSNRPLELDQRLFRPPLSLVGLTQAGVASRIGRRYLDGLLIGLLGRRPIPSGVVPVAQSYIGLPRHWGSLNRRLELGLGLRMLTLSLIESGQADIPQHIGRGHRQRLPISVFRLPPPSLTTMPIPQNHQGQGRGRGHFYRCLKLGQCLLLLPLSRVQDP